MSAQAGCVAVKWLRGAKTGNVCLTDFLNINILPQTNLWINQ